MEFFRWLGRGVETIWNRLFSRQDASDRREELAFQQALKVNEIVIARIDRQDDKIVRLQIQNAEQAAQMERQRRQIDECKEKHDECEARCVALAAKLSGIDHKVSTIETKLLPG